MNATERAFRIKRALLQTLEDCNGYPVLESALRDQATLKVDFLRPTTAELDAGLMGIDVDRLSVALKTERGYKYQLTDAGRLWLAVN